MILVIDANVAIAAVAARGLCEAVMELCLEHHQIVLCEGILAEIEAKLRDKLRVPAPVISEYTQILRNSARVLEPDQLDPKDASIN